MVILAAVLGFVGGAILVGFVVYSRQRLEVQTWKTRFELTEASSEQNKAETQRLQGQLTLQFENLSKL